MAVSPPAGRRPPERRDRNGEEREDQHRPGKPSQAGSRQQTGERRVERMLEPRHLPACFDPSQHARHPGEQHAGGGRPTDVYAGFCGRLPVDWYFCGPGDAPAKGAVERLQGYLETNFEPGRHFFNERDYQDQLDACSPGPTRARTRRCAAGRSTG